MRQPVPEIVETLSRLPPGSHCISLHTSPEEAADHAVDFLAGTPPGQAASYWVPDSDVAAEYNSRLEAEAPGQVGCVRALAHEQVAPHDGRLRPVPEIVDFVTGHPGGVTGGADTISRHWTRESVPDHLEYEAWFDGQPRKASRFLCPYDLRTLPVELVPQVLRGLGTHHSHVSLSNSTDPALHLLQLFLFPTVHDLPPQLHATLGGALALKHASLPGLGSELVLTAAGETVVRNWSRDAVVDW